MAGYSHTVVEGELEFSVDVENSRTLASDNDPVFTLSMGTGFTSGGNSVNIEIGRLTTSDMLRVIDELQKVVDLHG